MKDKLINSIVADMNNYLNNYQLEQLKKNLICTLCNIDFIEKENALNNEKNCHIYLCSLSNDK